MKFLTRIFVALLLVVGIIFGSFHSDAHAASPLPINIKIDVNDIKPIANRIKFERKYTVLVANKTGKTLERVRAYNQTSNWPIGDIEPNAIVGQQFDGAPGTNAFSFASNYRVEPGKNIQLSATFPMIGRRKIGI
ncbi:MAG: hypothetical protein HWQ35_28625 [Nostoc sp. NMS1]|uniref:hypothetical protein n=1 Tax=unclassified Nostoc TaxID=2593658 RepID=UPI0025E3D9E8|nr:MULTISPECIES: hypothetical protein [unclassified Nostoc]MBN3910364.1 hypothetical protein [Nostoc sp. NMS1]MBN3994784.1 hypothetical protein [Nostoc sp. NMS2]